MYSDARLKKLHMRSWRRGMKEMDIIFGRFADKGLGALDEETLVVYETLLGENDQAIYAWYCGFEPTPAQYVDMLSHIKTAGALK